MIELGCPAIHETIADFDLQLPNSSPDCLSSGEEGSSDGRLFEGQRFVRHISSAAEWKPTPIPPSLTTTASALPDGDATVTFVPIAIENSAEGQTLLHRDIGFSSATSGLASAVVLKAASPPCTVFSGADAPLSHKAPTLSADLAGRFLQHDAEFLFFFVLSGSVSFFLL